MCYLVITWLVPHETAAILVHVLCTPHSVDTIHSSQCHIIQSHKCRVQVCLAVTPATCSTGMIFYMLLW